MMGSGKSSVGRALAQLSGREFVDTDHLLASRMGRPVRQFFALYGEESFRELETKVLRELEPSETILSTGGGIVLRDENRAELKRLGPTLYLRCSPELLIERLSMSKNRRPLLEVENWEDRLKAILEARTPIYEQSDLILNVNNEPIDEVAQAAFDLFTREQA